MKVLLMASTMGGGLTYGLTLLAISIRRRGHEVSVISSGDPGSGELNRTLVETLEEGNIRVYKSAIESKSPYHMLKSSRKIASLISSKGIDVIHANGLLHALTAYLGVKMSKRKKPPIVCSVHYMPFRGSIKKRLYVAASRVCVDIMTPVSEWTRENLIRHGLPPEKAITAYNGIDLERFDSQKSLQNCIDDLKAVTSTAASDGIVAYVATLFWWKGHCYYLQAAKQVLQEFPDSKFLVVGDGPLRNELEGLAVELGITKSVVFTGQIDNLCIPCILSNITVGVSSSLIEQFPLNVLELMAAGKPVVATTAGGTPEMVKNGETGLLVPPMDSSALAEGIITLLKDPVKAREMGRQGRGVIEEHFSMDVTAAKMESVYTAAV